MGRGEVFMRQNGGRRFSKSTERIKAKNISLESVFSLLAAGFFL